MAIIKMLNLSKLSNQGIQLGFLENGHKNYWCQG